MLNWWEDEELKKVHSDAEATYAKMKAGGVIICTLPRKKPDIAQLVPYKPLLVLMDWN